MKNSKRISEIFSLLREQNKNPKPELDFTSAYTLLVAVVLSAQSTDKGVNAVTKDLFAAADTPQKMISLGEEKLIEFIKPVGLYKNKSKHILELSRALIEHYDSKVPDELEALVKLPGVGRKTANVVLNVWFKKPTMPVDTHVFRVSNRLGLSCGNTPEKVEKDLLEVIPDEFALNAHHWLLLLGRYICTARNPKCGECPVKKLCKNAEVTR